MTRTNSIAQRLRAAGGRVEKSDRSETIYLDCGLRNLRVSTHDLGWADYGTRQQYHHGPELVYETDDDPADVLAGCIHAVREWAAVHADAGYERRWAAQALRVLRLARRRAADPRRRRAKQRARERQAARRRAIAAMTAEETATHQQAEHERRQICNQASAACRTYRAAFRPYALCRAWREVYNLVCHYLANPTAGRELKMRERGLLAPLRPA